MPDTEDIMARFNARQEARAGEPPRKREDPVPVKPRFQVPTHPDDLKILRGAIIVAEGMLFEYPERSKEAASLAVLINLTKRMLGDK
jgi:hypothetical protein